MDEVFVLINGERRYLWRAGDQEREVLEVHVTKTRDRKATLDFLRWALKRFSSPCTIVTDCLRSCRWSFSSLGIAGRQDTTRWRNNRAEENDPDHHREGAVFPENRSRIPHPRERWGTGRKVGLGQDSSSALSLTICRPGAWFRLALIPAGRKLGGTSEPNPHPSVRREE